MSIRNHFSIPDLGVNKNRVAIAARSDSVLFDIVANAPGVPAIFSASDITVEQAQTIVNALTACIAEVKESITKAVPDIELPFIAGDDSRPVAITVTLDGAEYRLVNWADYRGWEVRRAASEAPTLGWLTRTLIDDTRANDTFRYTRTGYGWGSVAFKRVDDTLRALVNR